MSGLPSSWKRTQIGSICDVVRGSSPRPIADQRYFDGGTIPWIKIADATKSGRFLYDTREKVNEYGASFSRLLPKGSLIVAASGTLGYTQMLGVPGCIHDGWLHLSGFRGVEKLFLYYWLKCQVQHFTSSAYGAAIQNINTAIMRESVIDLPPLDDQFRIALTLSAYDDLIENNTRRISILEEMARRIYEEWFVRVRFPGHEGVRMVESELGLVPEGWRTDVLAGVCEPKTGIQTGPFGSQLHKADYSEVGVPVLMPKDLIEFRIEEDSVARVPEATAESLKRHRMRPGDIAYGRRGDIGRRAFIMAHQAGWLCGTGCLRIRPDAKKINGWYVFNYLGQDNVVGLIAGRAHGVTMPNLNAQLLESVPVVCPPRELQDQFERISFPMAELRESLIAKNANLRTTRDLLLPKLISGELGVSAMPEPEALAA